MNRRRTDNPPLRTTDWIRIGFTLIPYVLLFLMGKYILSGLVQGMDLREQITAGQAASVLIGLIVYWFLWRFANIGSIVLYFTDLIRSFRSLASRLWLKLLLLIPAYLLVMLGTIIGSALAGADAQNEQMVQDMVSGMPFVLAWLYVAVYTPLIEELIFRHVLIGKLGRRWNVHTMAAISCFLFAFAHAYRWTDMLIYLPLSVVFTVVYMLSGRQVAYSYLLHVLNNTMALVLPLFFSQ